MRVNGPIEVAGLEELSSDPTPAWKGRLYFNTTSNLPKFYDGTSWLTFESAAGTSSFSDDTFEIKDDGDNTKIMKFQVASLTTLTTRTYTVPDADGTLVLSGAIVDADINAAAAIAYSKLALADSILNADINSAAAIAYSKLDLATSIVNADVNAAAAIVYSKLNLADGILNADINTSAAIAYSKLDLATSIVNADVNAAAAIVYSKLSLSDSILNADINSAAAIVYSKLSLADSLVNADVNSAAAIAYSKLDLTTSIVNGDVNAAAAIVYSKLSLADSLVNADINSAAAIAYSKLDLASSIVDADVNATAAIAYTKLAALAASRATETDGSGFIVASAVTSTELNHLDGVTGPIQTQFTDHFADTSTHGVGEIVGTTESQTLDNKDILVGGDASDCVFRDATDTTKRLQFLLNQPDTGSTNSFRFPAGTPSVYDLPAGSGAQEIVTANSTDTLTQKTVDANAAGNTYSNFDHGSEVDNPTAAHGVGEIVGTTENQTLSTKTLASPIVTADATYDNQAEARYREQTGNGVNYVGFSAPDAVTTNQVWKLPDGDGTANQVLKTNGTGDLSWVSQSGSGGGGGGAGAVWYAPAGSGALEGEENGQKIFTFDDGFQVDTVLWVQVPSTYVAASQIFMDIMYYTSGVANNIRWETIATLLKLGDPVTDAVDTETDNSGDILLSGSTDALRSFTHDISDSGGLIGGVVVAAGDMIKVQLKRTAPSGTSQTADVKLIPSPTQVRFS